MNVKIPFASHPWAFWIVIGISTVSLAVFMLVWRIFNKQR
jgi:Mg2+ and Co2+ transporter CorA